MKSVLVICLMKMISLMPLCLARFFGRVAGVAMSLLSTTSFKIAKRNLTLSFPKLTQHSVVQLAKNRMGHLGQTFFETPILWRKPSAWLKTKIIAVEGQSYLKQALANDNGTILLIPHQGNWEVIGLWVAQQTAMTSLYQPPKMSVLDSWIKSAREKTGASLVPTNVRGVSALLKALKRGETVAILPDQQPPKASGDFSPLFGVQALTMTLAHNLLNRSNSQAIFCCALREKNGWRLHFMPADQAIYSEDQAVSLSAMNAGVESVAAMAPEQYQWEYKRFRAQPDGSPAVYEPGI
jgi:KDO2-lipid IV(A) lauroyltransferase